MIKEYYQDITAFGSLVFYIFIICLSIIFNFTDLSWNLIIALLFCYLIGIPLKLIFFKKRPNKQKYSTLIEKFDASSFPSVHAMRVTSLGLLLMMYFSNLLLSLLIGLVIVGVYVTRILLHKHYGSDVVVGGLVGVGISYFVLILL